ncbi:MAG: DUF4912 domain-containing protein [Thermodesulfobacteriota bacterium]|nr:DUF4912 domain-containing protein [Thermodesulfobacteriota bacterium]
MTQKVEKPSLSKAKAWTQKRAEESAGKTVEDLYAFHEPPAAANNSYGETIVVAVAVDPYLIHVYWEVASERLKTVRDRPHKDYGRSRAVLRCYGVTSMASHGGNATHAFDVDIDLESRSRYIHLWSPGNAYLVELGFRSEEGSFYPIARSNVVEVPRVGPAPQGDEADMVVQGSPKQGVSDMEADGGPRSDSPVQPRRAGPGSDLPREGSGKVRSFQGTDLARPQVPFAQGVQGPSEEGAGVDLTDMSEKEFTLGLSSQGGASPRKEKDSADR